MTKPGSTWTGEERAQNDVVDGGTGVVTTEPESINSQPAQLPTPVHAKGHARSLSGAADEMPVPSLTLSPSPTHTPSEIPADVKLDVDLSMQTDPPRTRTPTAEAYQHVICDPEFWMKLLAFLNGQFKTPDDAEKAWEEFFLTSKTHLTPHEIAKIRDETGLVAMAGN